MGILSLKELGIQNASGWVVQHQGKEAIQSRSFYYTIESVITEQHAMELGGKGLSIAWVFRKTVWKNNA